MSSARLFHLTVAQSSSAVFLNADNVSCELMLLVGRSPLPYSYRDILPSSRVHLRALFPSTGSGGGGGGGGRQGGKTTTASPISTKHRQNHHHQTAITHPVTAPSSTIIVIIAATLTVATDQVGRRAPPSWHARTARALIRGTNTPPRSPDSSGLPVLPLRLPLPPLSLVVVVSAIVRDGAVPTVIVTTGGRGRGGRQVRGGFRSVRPAPSVIGAVVDGASHVVINLTDVDGPVLAAAWK